MGFDNEWSFGLGLVRSEFIGFIDIVNGYCLGF